MRVNKEDFDRLETTARELGHASIKELLIKTDFSEHNDKVLHLGHCQECGKPFTFHLDVPAHKERLNQAVNQSMGVCDICQKLDSEGKIRKKGGRSKGQLISAIIQATVNPTGKP
jgi:hypothetical protein